MNACSIGRLGALALSLALSASLAQAQVLEASIIPTDIKIEGPARFVPGREYGRVGSHENRAAEALRVIALGPDGEVLEAFEGDITVRAGDDLIAPPQRAIAGVATFSTYSTRSGNLEITAGGRRFQRQIAMASLWSLVPPLVAIGLALWFRQVLIALFGGIWLGQAAVMMTSPDFSNNDFAAQFFGFLPALSDIVVGQLCNSDHVKTILFTLLMGGMVGIVTRSGGMRAIVDAIARTARTARSAQMASWIMGLCIFFDDYANCILVGNTMRPFTDRFRISREKLAYIVDSTAAPVAGLFLVSTWIGYEVGLIDTMLQSGIGGVGYQLFVSSIPYRFYNILCLAFVFIIVWTGRDFGPMLTAELRARQHGKVLADGASPLLNTDSLGEQQGLRKPHWALAVAPVGTMILAVFLSLLLTGSPPAKIKAEQELSAAERALGLTIEANLELPSRFDRVDKLLSQANASHPSLEQARQAYARASFSYSFSGVLSEARSYDALVWSAGLGALIALLISVFSTTLELGQSCDAFMDGVKSMLLAVVVLTLAWSLGEVCDRLETGAYLAELARFVRPSLLPALVFTLSSIIAFCTGTSFGTMAIVFPILGPLLVAAQTDPVFEYILNGSVGAVLAGACFGDHASPISDTTVLSSMASGSDHIDHVRTQLPYAGLCAALSLLLGYLPSGFGFSPWIGIVLGLAGLLATLWVYGQAVETDTALTSEAQTSPTSQA